jgi:hypothetical protein
MSSVNEVRMDRTVSSIGTLKEQGDERAYWATKTPQERIEALELLRQIHYGYDPASERLQRVFTISQRAKR